MAHDSKYMEYMMMKMIINGTWTKKIKVLLRMVSPNNKCDAEANNHELGQQALCFWESEKKSTQLRAELKLDQGDL